MAALRTIRAALAALALLAAPGAAGAEGPDRDLVVVELFTSQGCSSCPPANRLLQTLADDPRVLALGWHVDYWDYLGWRDSFGAPEFTRRQRAYAGRTRGIGAAAGIRGIFTPEMVIEGQESLVGSAEEAVAARIAAHVGRPDAARVAVGRTGDRLSVTVRPGPDAAPAPAEVLLVTLRPRAEVAIGKGENAGQRITYVNIVRDVQRLARWDGTGTLRLTANGVAAPAAVLVQREGPGPILGAALAE